LKEVGMIHVLGCNMDERGLNGNYFFFTKTCFNPCSRKKYMSKSLALVKLSLGMNVKIGMVKEKKSQYFCYGMLFGKKEIGFQITSCSCRLCEQLVYSGSKSFFSGNQLYINMNTLKHSDYKALG